MSTRQLWLAALSFAAWLAACADPIVGAECRDGLVRCGGQCVEIDRDPANCGRCGNDCGRFECRKAACGPGLRPDSDGGSSRPDGSGPPITPGGVGSPFLPDGGLSFPDPGVGECGLGQIRCFEQCKNPLTDPNHCGNCETKCPGSGMYCAGGVCNARCAAPYEFCAFQCVDLQSSPEHCGGCNAACASGICQDGACDDIVPGQLVIFGHDYSTPSQSSTTMKRLAGNALFLARGAPVRALVYRGAASEASAAGVVAAIEFTFGLDGRPWTAMEATAEDIPRLLYESDAFIIHAQHGASDEELLEAGRTWGRALSQFLLRGGVVLLFDAPTPSNSGTYKLLAPSGLFDADRRTTVERQTLTVVSPGIGVAARATRSYRSANNTVRFLDVTTPGNVVVEDRNGEAVVLHRIVSQ